ncbi:MAG: TIGR02147 family protein [Chitinispirillaceae bacterium]|nr:TIGR02147 family protein [Chitinispirillaceae bacterium]
MKPVFEYIDYRDFLREHYEEQKELHSFFSYRYFGNKVGLDPSYLLKVMLKTRHLAEKSIPKLTAFLKFNPNETEYFHTMVLFIKAKSQRESKLHFEKLLSIKNVKNKRLVEWQYEYFCTWYHPVIRSVLEYFDFKDDYTLLGQQLSPSISEKEARESVRLLEKLKLIERDSGGRYKLTDSAITTGSEWRSLAISTFQEQTIKLSQESIERHKRELRDISTITMNINEENFEEIRHRITEFRRSIIAYVGETTTPDRTYQLNMQFFPLTDIKSGKQ